MWVLGGSRNDVLHGVFQSREHRAARGFCRGAECSPFPPDENQSTTREMIVPHGVDALKEHHVGREKLVGYEVLTLEAQFHDGCTNATALLEALLNRGAVVNPAVQP